ncbi:IS110 family transposase, partial [Nonomuraea diastatica]|uniref:IS110 family transposase n=1 Tax=Nonomuraea diastatica TaxID=1848329 RepID=UPI00140D27FF
MHKKKVWVAVRLPGRDKPIVKSFKTFWPKLRSMADWLVDLGVTDVAMESTGVYWWPVYHALVQTGILQVCVANAAHIKNVPGRKTDIADCQWIAELHAYGLLRTSFIPDQQIAALRQRTRYRKKLIEQRTAEAQRLTKVLEDGGIKIDSVASDLFGVSGRAMVAALIAGERDPHVLADMARGRLRNKAEDLVMACEGRFTEEHAAMAQLHLDAYDHLTR